MRSCLSYSLETAGHQLHGECVCHAGTDWWHEGEEARSHRVCFLPGGPAGAVRLHCLQCFQVCPPWARRVPADGGKSEGLPCLIGKISYISIVDNLTYFGA